MPLLLCLLLCAQASLSPRRLARAIEAEIEQPVFADSHWGVAIYAPWRGRWLYQRHASRNFRPASNLKILTTLLAFEHLGPDHVFQTEFWTGGPLTNGVLSGDLIVVGQGDPSFSGNYSDGAYDAEDLLDALAARLYAAGLRRVDGGLVAAVGFFDDQPLHPAWEWDDVGRRYCTPVTPLSLHDGWIEIALRTDDRGALSHEIYPPWTPGLALDILAAADDAPETRIRRVWGANRFELTQRLPPCAEYRVQYSAWEPALQYLEGLRAALARQGVTVAGASRISHDPPPETARFFEAFASDRLAVLARVLMKDSQNHYANCFLKTAARLVGGEGSFAQGAALAAAFLDGLGGVDSAALAMRDGSGLSPQNNMQPRMIALMLDYALRQPYRDDWLAAFPIMGVDGTLENRGLAGGAAVGRVWAKTGYINRTRCLSGYAETLAGEPLIFAIMVNNYSCDTGEVETAQDRICELLVSLRPNRAIKRRADRFSLSRAAASVSPDRP